MMWGLIGVLGAVLGSFSNMLVYRLPRSLDWVFKRSFCPDCNTSLKVQDLVPIMSYLCRLGRCGHCKERISIRYLVVEVLVMTLGLVCYGFLGLTLESLMMFLFFWVMILVVFIDLAFYVIPDELTGLLAVVGTVWSVLEGRVIDSLWGCLCGAGIYFSLGVVSRFIYKRETMGLGDVKLGAAIGLFWGLKVAGLTVYLSFMIGGVGGAAFDSF